MEVANNAQHFIVIFTLLLLIIPAHSFSLWQSSNQDAQKTKENFGNRQERHAAMEAPNEDCITSLFRTMQSCCPVPLLVPTSPQERCTGGIGGMARGLFHTMREKIISPFRNARTNTDPETIKQKVIAGQMCAIECTFKEMQLIVDDKMDLNKTEEYFNNLVMSKKLYKNSPWIGIVKQALSECSKDIENLSITTVTSPADGKSCSTQSGYYMQCARRAFILNCPVNEFSISDGCVAARSKLVNCNPLDVLKGVKA